MGLLYLLVLLTAPDSTVSALLSDLSFVAFPAIAATSCFTGAAALPAAQRRTWHLIGCAMTAWTCGGAAWCFYSFTRAEVPFPSIADGGFLVYSVPAGAALLLLPLARHSRLMRLEILLDALVMATSVTVCAWVLVLQPVLATGGGLTLEWLVLLAYPVGDILTISLVLATVMRVHSAALRSWFALLLGLLVLAGTDLLYVSLVARGLYDPSALYNVLWALAFLLVAAAPHLGGLDAPDRPRLGIGRALIPYAVLAAACVVALTQSTGPKTSSSLSALGVLLVALVAARQLMVVIVRTRLASDLERATDDLRTQREFLRVLVDSLHVGVVACDRDGELTFHNRTLALLHGDPDAARMASWPHDLRSADGSAPLERDDVPLFRALAGDLVQDVELMVVPPGAPGLAFTASGCALRDESGSIIGAVVTMHDITEHRRQQDELRRKTLRDDLTSLGNRAAFTEALQARLVGDLPAAVLLCDLDDFKHINDSLGHDAGDQYLAAAAGRLAGALPTGCHAFRLGGDEFVVIVDPSVATPRDCAEVVLDAISAPVLVAGTEVHATTSIGIAVSGPGYGTVGELLKAADLAMYVAKAAGKGRVSQYEEHLRGVAQDRLALESDLRSALGGDELFLVYQPIVDVGTGRMRAAEALVRWNHPTRGPISPVEFIPVAEQTGLILPLGAWVMQQACAQLLAWDAEGGDDTFRITVNLSTRQLEHPGLLSVLDDCLRAGVHPARLVLEVTETALTLDSEAAMRSMHAIRARGVHLAVDDFGTGYSSLSRLRSAPVSRLKIDRSFISEIDSADAHVPIVEAMMAMARGLGMGVIAEGVETLEQLEYLSRASCPEAQGFLLSRPLGPDALFTCLTEPPWAQLLPMAAVVTAPADGIRRLVELAVDPRVALEQLIRPLLKELAVATGLATTYLTRVDVDGDLQEVSFLEGSSSCSLQEGLLVPWSESLCKRALDDGPRRTSDAGTAYLGSDLPRELRMASFIVEPVSHPDGRVYGTLCGTSQRSLPLSEADSATMRLYARLIEQKLSANDLIAARLLAVEPDSLVQRRAEARETWTQLRDMLSEQARDAAEQRRRSCSVSAAERAWDEHTEVLRERAAGAAEELRVVIADDSRLLRQVLGALISSEEGLRLAGEADSAWVALGVVGAEQPDILVLDHDLGDAKAADVIDHIRAVSPGTRVLLHSARPDIHLLGQLMQVDRVVPKNADPEQLALSLRSLSRPSASSPSSAAVADR